jgi:hypothetical protein
LACIVNKAKGLETEESQFDFRLVQENVVTFVTVQTEFGAYAVSQPRDTAYKAAGA